MTTNNTPPQRRKFPRANYPCSIAVWRSDGDSQVVMANTADISAGGFAVYLNRPIPPKTGVEVSIELLASKYVFKFQGFVLRCDRDSSTNEQGQNFYKVAIQFQALDEFEQATLAEIIHKLIQLEGNRKNPQAPGA